MLRLIKPIFPLAAFKPSPRPSQILVRSTHNGEYRLPVNDIVRSYANYGTSPDKVKEQRMESFTRTNEHIDPAPEDTKPEITTDIPKSVNKPLALSVINAKLAAIQTKASVDTQSIKTEVGNLSTNLSAKLDEFKSRIATLGQELSLAKFLEELKRTTKEYRIGIDGVNAKVDQISQLAGDIQMTKNFKSMADKIGVICNVVNGVSTRTDYIDTRIANMEKMVGSIVGDIGGTGIKVESPEANNENAAIQRSLTATTVTAMEWTRASICAMIEMQSSIEKIERLFAMHSKPAPATNDTENVTKQLVDSTRDMDTRIIQLTAIAEAMTGSWGQLENSSVMRINSLGEKVDESTSQVEILDECVHQVMRKLVQFITDYHVGQRNIQGSIAQMESQINSRLCRIEEASLNGVFTESTKEQATKSSKKKWDLFNDLSTPELVLILMFLTATFILLKEIAYAEGWIRVKEDKALATTAVEEMGGGNGEEQKNKRAWGLWQ